MTYVNHPKVATRRRNDTLILSNVSNGIRYKLDGFVCEIWEGIRRGKCIEQIEQELEESYGSEARKAVSEYVNHFWKEGILIRAAEEARKWEIESGSPSDEHQSHFINKTGLSITNRCNFQCIHCYNNYPQRKKDAMQIDDWKRAILELKQMGCLDVLVTGGEPFLYEHIFDLLDHLERHEFVFELNSNGSVLTESVVKGLQKYQFLKRLNISLYGLTKETYQRVTGIPFNPMEIVQMYKKLLYQGIPVVLKYLYLSENFTDALHLADFEQEHGVKILKEFDFIHPNLRGETRCDLNLTFEQLKRLYDKGCIHLQASYTPLLQCGRERCSINAVGDVSLCEKFSNLVFGNIFTTSIPEIWQSSKMEEFIASCKPDEKCANCNVKEYCCRCNGLSFLETGSPYSSVPSLCRLAAGLQTLLREQ